MRKSGQVRKKNVARKLDDRTKIEEPMLRLMTSLSSVLAVEGFKNGGLENMLSNCGKSFLQASLICMFLSCLPPIKPLNIPPKIPGDVSCGHSI